MRLSWLYALFFGAAVLFSFSACDDSSDVGLGVGPDSLRGGAPVTLDIFPALDTTVTPSQTGLELRPQPGPVSQANWRFLAGRVNDPIGGTIEASGYVDVLGRDNLSSNILNAEADSVAAQLRLTPTYVHGDTLSPVTLRVLNLAQEAPTDKMDGATADTTFAAGSVVTTASISPTDSLVTIDLPQSWLTQQIPGTGGRTHLSVLQDTSDEFQEDFYGFKLAPVDGNAGNAVVGFSSTRVTLQLTHLSDSTTAIYPGFKTFTHIERRNVPPPPEEYLRLQDGTGVHLTMNWAYDEPPLDTLQNNPLNRADIFVPVDTTALKENAESGFVRPLPQGFRVTARRANADLPPCPALGLQTASQDGTVCGLPLSPRTPPGIALVDQEVAFRIFEQVLLEEPVFTEYRVEIADRQRANAPTTQIGLPSTIPVLIPRSEVGEFLPPRAVLTVTPL